jgi:hypothetical protein
MPAMVEITASSEFSSENAMPSCLCGERKSRKSTHRTARTRAQSWLVSQWQESGCGATGGAPLRLARRPDGEAEARGRQRGDGRRRGGHRRQYGREEKKREKKEGRGRN